MAAQYAPRYQSLYIPSDVHGDGANDSQRPQGIEHSNPPGDRPPSHIYSDLVQLVEAPVM